MKAKVLSSRNLKKIFNNLKKKGKKIVLCHGVFDLLHIGHIKHFAQAKENGDILVVSITADQFVNKGPNRPTFQSQHRLEAVAALDAVDYVISNQSLTAVEVIKEIQPDIYCKGEEYKNVKNDTSGEIRNEINAIKKVGGKIIYTSGITFSSSNLINNIGKNYSPQQKSSISKIKKNYMFSEIKDLIDNFKKLKVLVIGEAIIDQYVFCEALGKSGKEPVLVLKDVNTEQYLGGALAISRHLSQFCNNITLLSMLGEKREFFGEINNKLPKNIKFDYIKKKNSPTIIKKRYLDIVNKNKILGVYKINDEALTINEEKLFQSKLNNLLEVHDLVIISDYGHGLISEKSSQIICRKSKYLALNAQINAANIGLHSMRKYKNIDCVIINENEIQHELRNKGDIKQLMKKLSKDQKIKKLVVTRGITGSLLYENKKKEFAMSDAFAKSAVDKIGAGDAMLSLIALSLKCGFSNDLALLISSLAAAYSVETMGNKESINKLKILKALEHLLK